MQPPLIRPGRDANSDAIAAICGHGVTHGLASFELHPPDTAEITRRRAAILAAGPSCLVGERNGRVAGHAHALANRFAVGNWVYVAPDVARGGTGAARLDALAAYCTAQGFRVLVAVIGDATNTLSTGLHARARLGVEAAAALRTVEELRAGQ
ncbi:GNAT family N-acetyltransferase [Roseomonas sp. CECT 9278]|uniref:GNAT family N-acetyltransferase n=1 Tax=Roseomonas sp. CECT 9278 TaxID=2845823 RepID=UPI001E4CE90E|nr:GNAT family N-acetyltransferase [Roseomonas sp. CECT 9278]CAH0159812.1 hypothetical protein ROS9278_00929 [Roseomonas sp. CECT 9278]